MEERRISDFRDICIFKIKIGVSPFIMKDNPVHSSEASI